MGLGFAAAAVPGEGPGWRGRRCAPGRWARGERNEAGAVRPWRPWHWVGNGSDAGPGAPLRRRVLGDWARRPRRTSFPPDRDATAGRRRVSGTVSGPARLSLFAVGRGRGASERPALSPGRDSGPALSSSLGAVCAGIGEMLVGGMESRGGSRQFWVSPSPISSPGFDGVVLLELTARDGCCRDTGRAGLLSPTGWGGEAALSDPGLCTRVRPE